MNLSGQRVFFNEWGSHAEKLLLWSKKEAELLFRHEIVEKIEKHSIPDSLAINFDQTPSKFVPISSTTLAKCNIKVKGKVKGSNDKREITATSTVRLEVQFLGIQLKN